MWMSYSAAGLDAFLEHCDDDVEWSPHGAGGRALQGADELRTFFATQEALGERREPTIYAIEEFGDTVVLTGALRIVRRGRWTRPSSRGATRSATAGRGRPPSNATRPMRLQPAPSRP